jgi:hypothetical protein
MTLSARLALALLLAPAHAGAQDASAPLPLPAYHEALDRICLDLEAGRTSDARGEAAALRGAKVEWAGEALDVDATLLDAVMAARDPSGARRLAPRVRRTVDGLRSARGLAPAARRPRPELLASLAPNDALVRGGEVSRVTLQPPTVSERIGKALLAALDWVGELADKIGGWLARFRPRSSARVADMSSTSTVSILLVSIAALVLGILAVRALRKGEGDPGIVSAAVVASARDEDPLSREAGEWERHARELAAAGRGREAIRAWYHAVLVALFRSGALHHQKGRTNWEYVSRLGPDLGWRPSFITMTRLFDREWYGRRGAGPDALRECAETARAILAAVRGGEAA